MKYTAKFPLTAHMSPISFVVSDSNYTQTKEEEALQAYNDSRAHDGLHPVIALPRGTTFTRMEEPTEIPFYG